MIPYHGRSILTNAGQGLVKAKNMSGRVIPIGYVVSCVIEDSSVSEEDRVICAEIAVGSASGPNPIIGPCVGTTVAEGDFGVFQWGGKTTNLMVTGSVSNGAGLSLSTTYPGVCRETNVTLSDMRIAVACADHSGNRSPIPAIVRIGRY
jgi:hypothetical protein